ncbi:hypothetical protein [Neisseria bacilliformis]|uniref:hypothetical protein n=1 Tax=Neisseria bacilliformis TaxID=267212 RepID=UPI0028EC24C2|nr:hypothetical protein [Neisseria bacilliformis]
MYLRLRILPSGVWFSRGKSSLAAGIFAAVFKIFRFLLRHRADFITAAGGFLLFCGYFALLQICLHFERDDLKGIKHSSLCNLL